MPITPHDAPFAIVSHYPDLLLVDDAASALVRGHVEAARGFPDFVRLLSAQGAPGPGGWARLEPIVLASGQPARDARGQVVNRWRLSDATLAALPSFLAEVLGAVAQDPKLEQLCWTAQEAVPPGPASASAAGWSLPALSPRHGVGLAGVEFTNAGAAFGLRLSNAVPRHLGLYGEFLRAGQPLAPAGWVSRLPPGVPPAFETAAVKYLGALAPSAPVAAIAVPAAEQRVDFTLPPGADAARVWFGGLGDAPWRGQVAGLGAILTAVVDQVVPAILRHAGAGHGQDAWFAALFADAGMLAAVMAAGEFLLASPAGGDIGAALAALAARVDALLLDTGLAPLRDAIERRVGAGAVEAAAPYLNWIWATFGALRASAALPAAPSRLAAAPATFALDLVPTLVVGVRVDLAPDPARGEWPDVADRYTVCLRDAAGVSQTQSGPVPADTPAAPLAVTFAGVRAGGPIAVEASLEAAGGWRCAGGATTLDARAPAAGDLAADLALAEVLVPITASTRYQHKRKLTYDAAGGQYAWVGGPPPSAVAGDLDPSGGGGRPALSGLVGLTLQERARCLGYTWKAAGQGLPACGAGGDAVASGYLFQNIGVVDPQAAVAALGCSYIQQPALAYDREGDPDAARAGAGRNFFLDAAPAGNFLRGVALGGRTPFDLAQTRSWGAFVEPNLADIVVHPAGYAVAVDAEYGRLEILALPVAPVPDAEAPRARLAAGAGRRAGLLDAPVALAVTPAGLLLVLEHGAARLQAFDVFGNVAPCFPGPSPLLPLPAEVGVRYLDLAVSPAGLIYVLSAINGGKAPADYRLDVYTPEGSFLARTAGVAAARIAVDSRGRVYTLNYEAITGANARTEPSVSEWAPSAPAVSGAPTAVHIDMAEPPAPAAGRQPFSCPGCDLSGHDFAGQDLTDANLRGATLTGASFRGAASLNGADLTGAAMGGADFSGCDLTRAIFGPSPNFATSPTRPTRFVGATVPFAALGTVWQSVDLTDAHITGLPQDLSRLQVGDARLLRLGLAGKSLGNAHFTRVDASGADFSGATLNNVVFAGQSDLTGAHFAGATIPYGVFDTSTLTRADFTGATLTGASFLQTRMDGTIFDRDDVTTCAFSQPPRFSADPSAITSFKGATLNLGTIGLRWSYLDLSGATLVGLSAGVDLTYLAARHTVLGPLDLGGYTLNQADFTGATLMGTKFVRAQLTDSVFDGVKGAGARFDGATMLRASFQADPTPVALHSAVFDNAILTDANFNRADLTGASFIQARLHGAVLTSTTLANANLTGAQLGTQALLFSVSEPAAYQRFRTALAVGDAATVIGVFDANGVPVRRITITVPAPTQQGTTWVVADEDTRATYTVRNVAAGGQQILSVFDNRAAHAALGDAYMPNVTLTSANLYGVTASGAHLYGAATKLDNAILEAVDFSKSNLGSASLQQATLYDAILDDAVLTNAHLEGAFLLPGQAGRGVSLQRANLQGAYLDGAKLYGANLQDAAMCLPLPNDLTRSNGVWLKEVAPTHPLYTTYLDELRQGARLFTLDPKHEANLAPGTVGAALRAAFAAAGQGLTLSANAQVAVLENDLTYQVVDGGVAYVFIAGFDDSGTVAYRVLPSTDTVQPFTVPFADGQDLREGPIPAPLRRDMQANGGVTLSTNARIASLQRAVLWQINDTAATYTLWEGYDEGLQRQIFARPAIPNLEALFQSIGSTLKRARVAAGDDGRWTVDNDSANPLNFTLGYVVFNVVRGRIGGPLEIYGGTLRIERLADGDRLEYYDILSGPTRVSAANFDAATIYPNGNKETIVDGRLQEAWLRAALPPRPPTCVPSDYAYCPSPSAPGRPRATPRRRRAAGAEG